MTSTEHPSRTAWAGRLAMLSGLVLGLAAGCAQPGTGTAGGPGPSAATTNPAPGGSAGASPPSSQNPPNPGTSDSDGCYTSLRVTEADTGRLVCLRVSGTLVIALQGAPGALWRPITEVGDALVPAPMPPGLGPAPAATVDAYRAVQGGTATVMSSRPLCPAPQPGSAACQAVQAFTLTVKVR